MILPYSMGGKSNPAKMPSGLLESSAALRIRREDPIAVPLIETQNSQELAL